MVVISTHQVAIQTPHSVNPSFAWGQTAREVTLHILVLLVLIKLTWPHFRPQHDSPSLARLPHKPSGWLTPNSQHPLGTLPPLQLLTPVPLATSDLQWTIYHQNSGAHFVCVSVPHLLPSSWAHTTNWTYHHACFRRLFLVFGSRICLRCLCSREKALVAVILQFPVRIGGSVYCLWFNSHVEHSHASLTWRPFAVNAIIRDNSPV